MQKTIEITLDGRTAIVRRLQLKEISVALKKLQRIPQALGDLSGKKNDEIFSLLPILIADNLEEACDILSIATDLTKDELQERSLSEVMAIVDAILEVNNFEEIRGFLARIRSKSKAPAKKKA